MFMGFLFVVFVMEAVNTALERLELIEEQQRAFDSFGPDTYELMEKRLEGACREFYGEQDGENLRDFMASLNVSFDPEEYIEHEESVELPPKVLAATVYLDLRPGLMTAGDKDDFFKIYISPHSDITEDEYFMVEEYVYQYYQKSE